MHIPIDFAWLVARAKEVGGDVVIELDEGQALTLGGVSLASLHADDFVF